MDTISLVLGLFSLIMALVIIYLRYRLRKEHAKIQRSRSVFTNRGGFLVGGSYFCSPITIALNMDIDNLLRSFQDEGAYIHPDIVDGKIFLDAKGTQWNSGDVCDRVKMVAKHGLRLFVKNEKGIKVDK